MAVCALCCRANLVLSVISATTLCQTDAASDVLPVISAQTTQCCGLLCSVKDPAITGVARAGQASLVYVCCTSDFRENKHRFLCFTSHLS